MKLRQVYNAAKCMLKEADNVSASFDTMCLFEHCFGLDRQGLIISGEKEADPATQEKYFSLVQERAKGYPLQYLLGEWEFMGLRFEVGEGVLIPRDDTQVLVDECLHRIEHLREPVVLDLCAGSGTIALSLAAKRKDAKIFALELSDDALFYLKKNIAANKNNNVHVCQGDIFSTPPFLAAQTFDVIVSNPPYIPSCDVLTLQKEVQYEPRMALDGGEDGLAFYRAIADIWLEFLKPGGVIAVEIGINQAPAVKRIFADRGICEISIKKDVQNIERVVSGVKRRKE